MEVQSYLFQLLNIFEIKLQLIQFAYIKYSLIMNKDKIVDFSNIYSPKSRQILSKGKRIIQNLSKTQKVHPNSKSRPKSPMHSRQFITNLSNVDSYRISTRIILTDDRIRQIHDRLEVDATTERGFQLRVKKDQLYINKVDNPLTRQFHQEENGQAKNYQAESNIFSQITKLKNNSELGVIKKRLVNVPTLAKDTCVKLQKQRDKEKIKSSRRQKENIGSFIQTKEVQQLTIKTPFQWLDELVERKEESYFQRNFRNQQKNIFLVIKDNNNHKFKSNKEILDKLYFNLDSIVTISLSQKQKFQNNCLDQISSFARMLVKDVKIKKMPQKMVLTSGDLNLNMERLLFDQMMLITTNKLSSSVLLKYFREEEQDTSKKKLGEDESIQKQQQQKSQIRYAHNTRNEGLNFNPINQDKAQIQYYGKSQFGKIEQQQRSLSKVFQQKLKRFIQAETISISNAIRDKSVMKKFKQEKDKTLKELLEGNADKRVTLLMNEVQRKIRMNKMYKNRTQKVKINILTDAFQMKKRMEGRKNRSSNSRDSSFSPLKTWRA